MRRREFITLVGGAAAWPRVARAQQPIPLIGLLGPGSPAGQELFVTGVKRGLVETGFLEGTNVAVDVRWANNDTEELPTLAAELVRRPVSVIATGGATAAALAAKRATSMIPIVFAVGADPVKVGLVTSMNRPGGNATGVSFLANALIPKQLELLHELVPTTSVVGAMVNPTNPNAVSDTNEFEDAARSMTLRFHVAQPSNEPEIKNAFVSLTRQGIGALLVFPDALFTTARRRIAALAAEHRLPTIYNRLYVEDGGLVSYAANQSEAFREAGIYVGRILKGEKTADLPVLQSTRVELAINLKTAKALGLEVPATLLARADEVIE